MSKRLDAAKRGGVGIVFYIVGGILMLVISLLMILYAAVDIIWQGVTGKEGLSPDGGYIGDTHEWYVDNHRWIVFGEGEFRALPEFG